MPRIAFHTFGCKLNQIETESLAESFQRAGWELVPWSAAPNEQLPSSEQLSSIIRGDTKEEREDAQDEVLDTHHAVPSHPQKPVPTVDSEILLVNTCTVTSKAEQKARRLIRDALSNHPRAIVIVTGCYAELDEAAIAAIAGEHLGWAGRLLVVPGSRKAALLGLPARLSATLQSCNIPAWQEADSCQELTFASITKKVIDIASDTASDNITLNDASDEVHALDSFRFTPAQFAFHSRPFLKVQDGCDRRCAYCRVPLARGGARSLEVRHAVDRLQHLEAAGAAEVVLAGINLSLYLDRTGSEPVDLADLLRCLLAETSHVRLRISSLEPDALVGARGPALLEALAHPRVQPHFHLPIQSGSDSVLARMRRPYTQADVLRAAACLRAIKADPFLGCDIIAGFPGETPLDAEATLALCRQLDLAAIHAFPFSPRPGTSAAAFPDRVPARTAKERIDALLALACEGRRAYIERWIGRTLPAVLEKDGAARTANYLRVRLASPPALPSGAAITVRLTAPASVDSFDGLAETVLDEAVDL